MKYRSIINSKLEYAVEGPGVGFGFYAGTICHYRIFSSEKKADMVAKMCNDAYRAGHKAAQHEIRTALGIIK